jgi:hypothetical protein
MAEPTSVALRVAALGFALLALVAGGLQIWVYVATEGPRHLILGLFALTVGACVTAAVVAAVMAARRGRSD